jgi:hypothetical protein
MVELRSSRLLLYGNVDTLQFGLADATATPTFNGAGRIGPSVIVTTVEDDNSFWHKHASHTLSRKNSKLKTKTYNCSPQTKETTRRSNLYQEA